AIPSLPSRADGIRVYRGFQGGNPWALNAEFRRGNYPSSYNDILAQGECGNPWPIHPLRGGGIAVQFFVQASTQNPGIVARRIYRSKANGSELFLLGEIQNNAGVTFLDTTADASLSGTRNPVAQTTGKQAVITIPGSPGPGGYVGRRVYRTR